MGILKQIAKRFAVLEAARQDAPLGRIRSGACLLPGRSKHVVSPVLEEAIERSRDGVLGVRIRFLPNHVLSLVSNASGKNEVDGYYLASDEDALYVIVFENTQVFSVTMSMRSAFIFEYNKIESIHLVCDS